MLPDSDDEERLMFSTDSVSIDTEEPLENIKHKRPLNDGHQSRDKIFIHSDKAKTVIDNERFKAIYEQMQDAIAQAEDLCEPPEYLPKEDDHNNIEYKFYMCNITFSKLEKRHT